jgi:hypothetical protein
MDLNLSLFTLPIHMFGFCKGVTMVQDTAVRGKNTKSLHFKYRKVFNIIRGPGNYPWAYQEV